jgi:hypothetical protein
MRNPELVTKGMAELTDSSVETRMLEVEQASMNAEAQARLGQIRSQLGLESGTTAAGEVTAGGSDTASDVTATPSEQPKEA